jgi:condensin-2 complex subunit G2
MQELMQSAILASTAPLAAALRVVLGGLHIQKKSADIESLLARLYEPILFRAFGAANAEVRRNALHLLVEAFPIRVRSCCCTVSDVRSRATAIEQAL